MQTVLIVIHLMVVVALVIVVLLQRSEGGALGIGGSSTGGLFTGRGQANALTRAVVAGQLAADQVVGTWEAITRLDVTLHGLIDGAAAVEGHAEVEGDVARDAELLRLRVEDVGELRIAQQRLGGDAAHVEADPAPVARLHDGDPQAELGGTDGGGVAARSRTEDDDVVPISHASNRSPAARERGNRAATPAGRGAAQSSR